MHVCMERGREIERGRERYEEEWIHWINFGLSFLITQLLDCTWLKNADKCSQQEGKRRKLIVYPSVIKNIISEFTVIYVLLIKIRARSYWTGYWWVSIIQIPVWKTSCFHLSKDTTKHNLRQNSLIEIKNSLLGIKFIHRWSRLLNIFS